jgi:Domain of unknown function (DUF4279)
MSEDFSLDRVTVGITIESPALTPEQISERVGTQPDETRRIGDPRGRTGKAWNCNVWRIFERKSGAVDTGAHDLLPVCLESFLHRLGPISSTMREICASEGGEFFIHVTARHVPGIGLAPEALQVLAASGLSLDVDIVLYGDD